MTTTDATVRGEGGPPRVAVVDWGTSTFRLWLLDESGGVLAERRSDQGMVRASTDGFEAVLESHLAAVGAPHNLPVVIAGMAGARQGWHEAAYVDVPARLDSLVERAVAVPGQARPVRILPGLAQRDPGRLDVMRGEETQLLGLAAGGISSALVCLPGTHSKWVRLEDATVSAFATFATGEFFSLLAAHSTLADALDLPGAPFDAAAFADGVDAAFAEPERITNRLFEIRAASLLTDRSPAARRARLSGLLVGIELAGARRFSAGAVHAHLVAAGPLADLYAAALPHAGFAVTQIDADEAVRRGLFAAAGRLLERQECGA